MKPSRLPRVLKPSAGKTFLPEQHYQAHELCFLLHDFMLELLRSAESHRLFEETFAFRDEADRESFENAENVFEWFDATGRVTERAAFLRRVVFPGLLSDFLHFVYVALDASRRANLAVSYALLRKPLQEGLFLFEKIAADLDGFALGMSTDPLTFRSQKVGGIAPHAERISKVLTAIGDPRFDAAYLAQLRYDICAQDGFDGVCNKAIHLVTSHPALRTEKLNLNFIFSRGEAKATQWSYLYSRLPYVLSYAQLLVEHVFGSMHRSDGWYTEHMQKTLGAAVLLWDSNTAPPYRAAPLDLFVSVTRTMLHQLCSSKGYREPTAKDWVPMMRYGRWPGEPAAEARLRLAWMGTAAKVSQVLHTSRKRKR